MPPSEPSPVPGGEVLVAIEVSDQLPQAAALLPRLEEACRHAIAELLVSAGIPGSVGVTAGVSAGIPEARRVRVVVNGQRCRFPKNTWEWVYAYVSGRYLADGQTLADCSGEELSEILSLACLEAIKGNLGALMGAAQAEAYCDALPPVPTAGTARRRPEGPVAPSWLRPILQVVLDLCGSIAHRQAVANVLAAGRGRSDEEVREQLLSALRPGVVEIIFTLADLQRIPLAMSTEQAKLFDRLRTDLGSELGVPLPPFRFVPDETVGSGCFAFKIGGRRTLPMRLLGPNTVLVNDLPARLPPTASGRPALIPNSNLPGALVHKGRVAQLEETGLTTWDESEHVILALADALRRHSASFVDVHAVQGLLATTRQETPWVVEQLEACMPVERITSVLRTLLASQVPIRRRAHIFSRLVEYADLISELSRDADEEELLQFIRKGLRREIKHRFARGDTVIAYLFDAGIEDILSHELRAALDDADGDRILDAIHQEMAHLPRTAMTPGLLTVPVARARLSQLVAQELPGLPVFSLDDLPPDTNIQAVARISLS